MRICISEIINKNTDIMNIHLSLKEENFAFEDELIEFNSPVLLEGTVRLMEGIIILDAVLTSNLKLCCSRCTEYFDFPLTLSMNEKFVVNPVGDINQNGFPDVFNDSEDDITILENSNIDLTSIIQNNIIISLPIKKLCSVDCKGLCQRCGTNLNFSTCNCEDKDIDPRLEKLRELLAKN